MKRFDFKVFFFGSKLASIGTALLAVTLAAFALKIAGHYGIW